MCFLHLDRTFALVSLKIEGHACPYTSFIETQGGGFPIWLVAKRNIRLRHAKNTLWKSWDQQYAEYCREWFQAILPIFVPFQITNDPDHGFILALQIENELFENIGGVLPIGLADGSSAST